MTESEAPQRIGPPVAGNEVDTLLGSLERIRATFAWKCGGLDPAGLRATVGASTMTIGGLLKHMALVEHEYFCVRLLGEPQSSPWADVDWEADPSWEWRTGALDPPDEVMALWRAAVESSRAAVTAALAEGGLDQRVRQSAWTDPPSLRRVVVDMIEEYARHTGHADLIRESVDGLVGEDPGD